MKDKAFQLGIFTFCLWRFYYNFVEVVPKWLNDSYFVIESLLVLIFIYSNSWNKHVRIVGVWGSLGSFLYFLLRYYTIFDYQPIGQKYFVPSFITLGILIAGIKLWQRYR